MSSPDANARDYCSELVKARDEDRWLAAGYAAPGDRRRLLTLYAFHCELRRIPSAVSEPPLGEIRLQWWRDALDEIRAGKPVRAHPVVEEMAAAGLGDDAFATQIGKMIDAGARLLYGEPFAHADDLVDWLGLSEGAIDSVATRLLGGSNEICTIAGKAGVAFALSREGRSLASYLGEGIPLRTQAIWDSVAPLLNNAPAAVTPALLHLSLTRTYLKSSAKQFPLIKRVLLFRAMALGKF